MDENIMTLRKLIEEHPEWADLPMAVYDSQSGALDYVGGSGSVYANEDCWIEDDDGDSILVPTLIFSGN